MGFRELNGFSGDSTTRTGFWLIGSHRFLAHWLAQVSGSLGGAAEHTDGAPAAVREEHDLDE
jgi:hypothetical protein